MLSRPDQSDPARTSLTAPAPARLQRAVTGIVPDYQPRKKMKPSNLTTPRTINECHWTPGYHSLSSDKNKSIGEIIAGYVLAVVIGVSIAALLIVWWSS